MSGEKKHECKEAEYKDTLQRLQAEFENYKKREARENEISSHSYKQKLISKFLPVLDSFEIALKSEKNQNHHQGMELIFSQLYSILESEGLKKIKAQGQKFDPYLHEAMLEGEGEDDMVIEEFQRGYTLNDAVIRHSKVKVGRKSDSDK